MARPKVLVDLNAGLPPNLQGDEAFWANTSLSFSQVQLGQAMNKRTMQQGSGGSAIGIFIKR